MNVSQHRIGEIVVDDNIYIFEVDSPRQQVCSDKNPILPSVELVYYLLALLLRFVARQRFHPLAFPQLLSKVFVYFIVELLCPLLLLHKEEHRGNKLTLCYKIYFNIFLLKFLQKIKSSYIYKYKNLYNKIPSDIQIYKYTNILSVA